MWALCRASSKGGSRRNMVILSRRRYPSGVSWLGFIGDLPDLSDTTCLSINANIIDA